MIVDVSMDNNSGNIDTYIHTHTHIRWCIDNIVYGQIYHVYMNQVIKVMNSINSFISSFPFNDGFLS